MQKKKIRLREKIKNKPKSRSPMKKKKKNLPHASVTGANPHPATANADEGMQAMSQVILDFAAPLLETCDDLEAEKKAIAMAIFVWNSTLLPETEQDQTLTAYLAECQAVMPAEELNTLKGYIDRLVQDKAERYADNRNQITNCTFGDYAGDRHIEVGYTLA
jgi:hypothetical protein